jgi:succinyl-CoA synthetase beta subunit
MNTKPKVFSKSSLFLSQKYTIIKKGAVINSEADIDKAISEIGPTPGYAIKAQVHTGGRGLGKFKENNFQGGVHVVSTVNNVKELVPKMLGKTLITKQSGEKGIKCNALYLVEKVGNTYLTQTLLQKNISQSAWTENSEDLSCSLQPKEE